jgi:hypothetical protein
MNYYAEMNGEQVEVDASTGYTIARIRQGNLEVAMQVPVIRLRTRAADAGKVDS